MLLLTSWDDGHPLDVRVNDLLLRHGFRGTFFIPMSNQEGRQVMSAAAVRELAATADIGAHTVDHVYLDRVKNELDLDRQVGEGKKMLEDVVGRVVEGFCYPGGKRNAAITRAVKRAGFHYARTVENFCIDVGTDRFAIPTTFQCYRHHRSTYIRNFVRGGHYLRRQKAFATMIGRAGDWLSQCMCLAERFATNGTVLHVWGHSWEIDETNMWKDLDSFLAFVAAIGYRSRSLGQMVKSHFE